MNVQFKCFLFGQFVSGFTSMLVQYALIWYLTTEYGSATILSIATMLGILPMVVLGLFIGGIIDRFSRKNILMISDSCVALFAIVLFFSGEMVEKMPLVLIFIALGMRAGGQAFQQPTIQAIIPTMVEEKDFTKANGQFSAIGAINMVISPVAAAFLLTIFDIHQIVLLDIFGAMIGCGILLLLKLPQVVRKEEKPHPIADMKYGVNELWKIPAMRYSMMIALLCNFLFMPAVSFYPLMTTSYFHGTLAQVGIVEMLSGVGMVIGGVVIGSGIGMKNRIKMLAITFLFMGIVYSMTTFLPKNRDGLLIFMLISLIAGISFPVINASFFAILQETYKKEILGRIMAITFSLFNMATPLGLVLITPFAEKIGIHYTFLIATIGFFASAILCYKIKDVWTYEEVLMKKKKMEREQEESVLID
ncbi:MFS transporter, DHA3 family, macrolide efflux protein [Pilibacter termitis]|uniref:MFS transporter, DHA3 family, macrolide efflux protein n=1 Tax=Pilibacter termitis TaxID=263852 RepID=A0A1T4P4V9_9ENTE|nr:MFS transporter [Pilibacter termitis]SJZ86462.1 MFS transporter, DHA3 family, macrolide efflux protein [Pilibacter termitis]